MADATTIVHGRHSHPGMIVELLVVRIEKGVPGDSVSEAEKVAKFLRENLTAETFDELARKLRDT